MTTEQIISIISNNEIYDEFIDNLDAGDDTITVAQALNDFYESSILVDATDIDERIYAVMEHTGDNYEDCIDSDYTVMTDSEADEAFEEQLEQYLDDCVLPELPESARPYFDNEEWMEDSRANGRGSMLSSFDGEEVEVSINGTDYYIYKQ